MSSDYSLFVHTVDGIVWKPGKTHGKTPNLYVAIYRDGIEIQRTRTVKRELAPTWDHLSKISSSSSVISLRLFHDSSVPFARDKCLGIVDIDVPTLKNLCVSNSDAKGDYIPLCITPPHSLIVVKLELKGVDGEFKGKPAGTVSVWLISDAEAAALAAQKAQKDVQNIGLPATISTPVAAGGSFEEAASTASELGSALASVASKLEIIVRIGDELATVSLSPLIHPYANIAWKVLTSVYQAVKKQHERDKKLIKLVETMAEVYSFVTDVDFLPERIQSLEDKALAIVKQTVECALFIQEYTANGFCARAIRNTWLKADKKIDELSETLLKLKESFDGRLTVQSVFISTKVLEKVESLEQSDTLKKLNPVDMNASLRAACLPGTRREILDEITGWLTVPSDTGNILWLSGVAGSGKSTISTTVSESFRAVDRLGAFLFFDRNDVSRSHPAGVIRTMAHSLALANPHIGSAISAVIGRDPAVVNAPMPTQFRQLLLEPLRSAEQNIHGPILIILDALDECGDPESRATLLSLLSDEFPKLPRLLRFLITSRREADITDQFGSRFVEMDLATDPSAEKVGCGMAGRGQHSNFSPSIRRSLHLGIYSFQIPKRLPPG
ncbi:hypothetical protein FB451DRAFT_1171549 [Mycena latifolia]|nr:hypothetical protein FB451DRAFT_1171549 [Mycena latifolia]